MTVATRTDQPQIEQWLDSHGLTPDRRLVLIANIDRDKSLRNQARFNPLDETIVESYAEAMNSGDIFPPIVVHEDATGYVVLDGNHRVGARVSIGEAEIEAYVLRHVSPAEQAILTYEANTKHGLPTSIDERRIQATYLGDLGISQPKIAQMLGLSKKVVESEIRRTRANRRLTKLGVRRWDEISPAGRVRIESIQNDNVLRELADLLVLAKPSIDVTSDLITLINTKGTEADQLAVVADERKRLEGNIRATGGGRYVPAKNMRFQRALAYAERMEVPDLTTMTDDYRKMVRERVGGVIKRWIEINEKL